MNGWVLKSPKARNFVSKSYHWGVFKENIYHKSLKNPDAKTNTLCAFKIHPSINACKTMDKLVQIEYGNKLQTM